MQFFWEWLLFVFSPPLGAPHRVSSEAQSRAPPTFSHPRHPRAPRLGSQIYSEDFFVSRDEAPYTCPVVWSPGRLLLQIQCKVFISDHWARRPVLLTRDDPQGREARFSHNGETRPKVLPIEELSWLHTERREEGIQARLPERCNLISLLKKLVKLAWREASSASRQSAALPSTRTGVSHTNDFFFDSVFSEL